MALNNLTRLICHKTQQTNQSTFFFCNCGIPPFECESMYTSVEVSWLFSHMQIAFFSSSLKNCCQLSFFYGLKQMKLEDNRSGLLGGWGKVVQLSAGIAYLVFKLIHCTVAKAFTYFKCGFCSEDTIFKSVVIKNRYYFLTDLHTYMNLFDRLEIESNILIYII